MGITPEQWAAAAGHLVATLDKFKVPEREKKEVLAAIATMEKDIVEAKNQAR